MSQYLHCPSDRIDEPSKATGCRISYRIVEQTHRAPLSSELISNPEEVFRPEITLDLTCLTFADSVAL